MQYRWPWDGKAMRLGKKQELFMRCLVQLLMHIHQRGFDVRGGELERSRLAAEEYARKGVGIVNSLHRVRLAIDLNLFYQGKYMRSTESHRHFGEFWESLHPLCRWGGRFGDGNHYSIAHGNRR